MTGWLRCALSREFVDKKEVPREDEDGVHVELKYARRMESSECEDKIRKKKQLTLFDDGIRIIDLIDQFKWSVRGLITSNRIIVAKCKNRRSKGKHKLTWIDGVIIIKMTWNMKIQLKIMRSTF